jgi:hypothetical protein
MTNQDLSDLSLNLEDLMYDCFLDGEEGNLDEQSE